MTQFEAIHTLLREHGPLTTKQIAAYFDWSRKAASTKVASARTRGLISEAYRLPDERPGAPEIAWAARDVALKPRPTQPRQRGRFARSRGR